MAVQTQCQTNDAIYSTFVDLNEVGIHVTLPFELSLSVEERDILKGNLHNAMELVLAKYFFNKDKP